MTTTDKPRTRAVVRNERIRHIAEEAKRLFAEHAITPLFAAGGFRAWRCQKPGSWAYGFDLYSVPGRLMIFGDIGTLVLARERDMLAWARASIDDVNYFAEKSAREIETEEYDPEMVRAWVAEVDHDVLTGEYEPEGKVVKAWLGGLRSEVLGVIDDGRERVYEVVCGSALYSGDPPGFDNWKWGYLWQREAVRWFLANWKEPAPADESALRAERDKLLAFKSYVHRRLDEAGVSADPDSPHKAEGCRVGGRLDEVLAERDKLRAEVERLRRDMRGMVSGFRSRVADVATRIGPARRPEDIKAEVESLHASYNSWADKSAERERDALRALLTAPLWLVWSNEHKAWWGPNRSQYYWDVNAAGRYTLEEALKICTLRGVERVDGINPPELIQPSPEWFAARADLVKTLPD